MDKFKILKNVKNIYIEKPVTADIFLTSRCNNDCTWCTYKRWDIKNRHDMTFESFKKYTDRLISLGVKGLILTGGGEPTINKDFGKITRYLEDNNIPYGINTNFNNYVECNPRFLKVSLDGYDRKSYKKIREVDKYDDVVENIKKYASYKTNTKLGIQTVVTNKEQVKLFYENNKNLDVDYIAFRPVEKTQGNYYKKEEVNEIFDEFKKINDKRILVNYKWEMLNEIFDECYANWSQLAINENGDVMYCCHKPYEIVGHILDADILEKKKNFKTNISMCDVPCRLTSSNIICRYISEDSNTSMFL